MRVDVAQLRLQAWRAEKLFTDMRRYAEQIGCEFFQDEIICDTEAKSRLLARWWREHTS
jgi:hypothetical protein